MSFCRLQLIWESWNKVILDDPLGRISLEKSTGEKRQEKFTTEAEGTGLWGHKAGAAPSEEEKGGEEGEDLQPWISGSTAERVETHFCFVSYPASGTLLL